MTAFVRNGRTQWTQTKPPDRSSATSASRTSSVPRQPTCKQNLTSPGTLDATPTKVSYHINMCRDVSHTRIFANAAMSAISQTLPHQPFRDTLSRFASYVIGHISRSIESLPRAPIVEIQQTNERGRKANHVTHVTVTFRRHVQHV